MSGPEGAVEYWHIGATMMRLRRTTSRIFKGVKRVGVLGEAWYGVPGLVSWRGVKYVVFGAALLRRLAEAIVGCKSSIEGQRAVAIYERKKRLTNVYLSQHAIYNYGVGSTSALVRISVFGRVYEQRSGESLRIADMGCRGRLVMVTCMWHRYPEENSSK